MCASFSYATNCADCPVGNPVQLATGAKVHTAEDYASAGAHPISFTRYYSSRPAWPYDSPGQTAPGPWTHNWSQFIDATYALPNANGGVGGIIYAVSADRMKVGIYRRQTNGTYVADAPVKDTFTIVKNASNVVTGFTIKRFEDDATEHYSTNGKLQKIVARNGWTYTLTYSTSTTPVTEYQLGSSTSNPPAPGLLMSVTNQFGRKIRLVYTVTPNTAGIVKARLNQLLPPGAIKDSGSGSATSPIFYQGKTQVIWQDGNKVQYKFDNAAVPDAMTSIVDEANNTIGIYSYDNQARVIEESAGDGSNRRTFSYGTVSPYETRNTMTDYSTGAAKSVTHILVPNKGVWVQSYTNQRCVECGDPLSYTDYDDQLRKKSTRTWDGTATFYTYDAKGRITEQATFPASVPQTLTRPALNLATSVITTQWHATFNLALKISEPGKITAFTYDAKGNVTGQSEVQTSDTTGALGMSAVQAVNTPTNSTGWSYNANSLPTLSIDQNKLYGETVNVELVRRTFKFSALGDTTEENVQYTAANPAVTNEIKQYSQFNSDGLPGQIVLPEGRSARITYLSKKRVSEVRITSSTGVVSVTKFNPDVATRTLEVTLPDAAKIRFITDVLGRLSKVEDSANNQLQYTYTQTGAILNRAESGNISDLNRRIYAANDPIGIAMTDGGWPQPSSPTTPKMYFSNTKAAGVPTVQSFDVSTASPSPANGIAGMSAKKAACVATCVGIGFTSGSLIGRAFGGLAGGVAGGAVGTAAPGVGNIGLGTAGAALGGAAGSKFGGGFGAVLGAFAAAAICGDECDDKLEDDNRRCATTARRRYQAWGEAICRSSAMERYSECLSGGGVRAIRTPLAGVETPLIPRRPIILR